jgi:hypothetical protein
MLAESGYRSGYNPGLLMEFASMYKGLALQ